MNTPLAQQLALSTFTPSTMPQATLEGMFVQREQLLQSIVEDLAASIDSTKQYLMLVGARGMGKTHFVSLAYHRLKQKPELQDRLLIAWLREEEYGVNSWLYLIIEILRSLSQEGIDTAEQINKLASLPIPEAEYLANRVLTELIGDRTLLIITENIDKLLYGLGDKEQWKFRAFLQETNCCSILATTPKISQDTSKKEKPFFNFFTSIHLPNFDHADAVAMLIKIANLSGNTQLAKFLNTDEGKSRVRALHHLAGGNPRVYALFAQLITEDTLEALLPAVIEMLDKLTPYYQSRVESLGQSDDQQKIVMYLARETRAVTVKEITAQCFISSENTTSNALKQLTQKGFLISTKKGREVYYEISEVLMRLCLEMKNAKNGDLKLCVDFIRIWFRPNERQEYLERLESNGNLEHAKYFRLSLADDKSDLVLLACQRDLRKSLNGGDIKDALQVWRELVCLYNISESEDRRIIKLINSEIPASTIASIEALLGRENAEVVYLKGLLLYNSEKWEEALIKVDIVLNLAPDNYEAWFLRGVLLDRLGKYETSIASYNQAVKLQPELYQACFNRGVVLGSLGRYKEAMTSFDRAIEINPNLYQQWNNRGMILGILGKYKEAISDFDRAIYLEPSDDSAWNNRGNVFSILGNYEDAISDFDRAVKIKPDNYAAWNNRARVLNALGKYDAEIDSYNRALEINVEDRLAWFNSASALGDLGRYEEAICRFDRALQIQPEDHYALHNKGVALENSGRYQESIDSYDLALQFEPNAYWTFSRKGKALYKYGKYQESLNAYEKAVNINPDIYSSWHDKGLVLFHLSNYSEALNTWQKAFSIVSNLRPRNTSDLIQEFLDEQLLPKFQQPAVRDILPQILTIYTTAQVLPELGVALTRNLKAIQSPTISDYTATQWLNMWQELGKPHPELALALRMVEAGIKYKQNPTDDRVFLSLPQEMRPLLREALGLES
jgi:tetratricopeptide (TPR) repeat protein